MSSNADKATTKEPRTPEKELETSEETHPAHPDCKLVQHTFYSLPPESNRGPKMAAEFSDPETLALIEVETIASKEFADTTETTIKAATRVVKPFQINSTRRQPRNNVFPTERSPRRL